MTDILSTKKFKKRLVWFDNKSCYSVSNSKFEGMCQQNNSMAKGYFGLTDEYGNDNRRAQPSKLVEYPSQKENLLYPVGICDYWLSYFRLSLEYNHNDSGVVLMV